MRTRKCIRYYCDFCKKAGLQKHHIEKHEKHCTKNPNRVCRVCGVIKSTQKPTPELLRLMPKLPNLTSGRWSDDDDVMRAELDLLNAAVVELRKATSNCPACIMATIRQSNIPVPMVSGFRFTEEMRAIWSEINDAKSDRSY